jgi:hypothetical protein
MWQKSADARKERKALVSLSLAPPPKPQPAPDYQASRLSRTRAQIELLNTLLEREATKTRPDAGQLDRLASALERLSELERILDGRPMPGTMRPGSAPPPRAAGPPPRPAPPVVLQVVQETASSPEPSTPPATSPPSSSSPPPPTPPPPISID